jgi:hypothetical protein
MIDTALVLGLGEPEETYSSSEHLYETLNIPAGSNGRITKEKPAACLRRSAANDRLCVKATVYYLWKAFHLCR